MSYSITEGIPAQWDEVTGGIIAFNQRQMGVSLVPPERFTRVAVNDNGELLGGILCTYTAIMENLFVDILWVDENHRGCGIGAALLRSAEGFARQKSCILAHLETLDFQARGFYQKQGYAVFGTLEGPPGHERYFMMKRL